MITAVIVDWIINNYNDLSCTTREYNKRLFPKHNRIYVSKDGIEIFCVRVFDCYFSLHFMSFERFSVLEICFSDPIMFDILKLYVDNLLK